MIVRAPVEVRFRQGGGQRCRVLRMRCQVFAHPALKKAKGAIASAGQFERRERMWVQQ